MKRIFSRGPSIRLKLFFAILTSIISIIIDSRFEIFIRIRTYMDTIVSPFYFFANIPYRILNNVLQTIATHVQLSLENRLLHQELLLKNSELLLLNQYKQENSKLRKLLGSPLCQVEQKMVAQVISINVDSYRDQVIIDKGLNYGVYVGQPVINDKGVIGQVIATNKFTSRVLLICDISHALPIQVLRNGTRMIVIGNGYDRDLQLEHIPERIDIRVGDMLVTSGLGGRFPEGYPVAIVSFIKVDTQRACTLIQAKPTANLQCLNYLLLLRNNNIYFNKIPPRGEAHKICQ